MAKRKQKPVITEILTVARKLPSGPKARVGKHITGGQLTMRFMCPVDEKQEKAIAAMLVRYTDEILKEAGKITGKELRSL